MREDDKNYIFKWLPDETPFIYILFETVIYCLDNLSPFVTKLYTYLLWNFNYHKDKCQKNGFSLFDDPYCVSLAGLGTILGFSKSRNTNRKVLAGLETLKKVGLIDFENNYYYKTLENGQVTHFYKINEVYNKSAVQESLAKWALKDSDIATADEMIFDMIEEEINYEMNDVKEEIIKEKKIKNIIDSNKIDKTYKELLVCTEGLYPNDSRYDTAVTIWRQFKNYFNGNPVELEVNDYVREVCVSVFGKDYCDALKCKNS